MKEEICNGVKKATFSYYSLAKFTFGIDEHEARPAITIIKKKERKKNCKYQNVSNHDIRLSFILTQKKWMYLAELFISHLFFHHFSSKNMSPDPFLFFIKL